MTTQHVCLNIREIQGVFRNGYLPCYTTAVAADAFAAAAAAAAAVAAGAAAAVWPLVRLMCMVQSG